MSGIDYTVIYQAYKGICERIEGKRAVTRSTLRGYNEYHAQQLAPYLVGRESVAIFGLSWLFIKSYIPLGNMEGRRYVFTENTIREYKFAEEEILQMFKGYSGVTTAYGDVEYDVMLEVLRTRNGMLDYCRSMNKVVITKSSSEKAKLRRVTNIVKTLRWAMFGS